MTATISNNFILININFYWFLLKMHLSSLLSGKNCAEYNFLGAKVQRNSKVKCTKCPSVYSSTEAFRCKIA